MRKFLFIFFILFTTSMIVFSEEDKAPHWNAKVPRDHETSPIMLNLLMAEALQSNQIPNSEVITMLKGYYEIKKHKFKKLKTNIKIDGIFKVSLKKDSTLRVPLDLAGSGPFYLLRDSGEYYLITPENFTKLFANYRNEKEAMNYLEVYENLFVDPLISFVTEENQKTLKKAKRNPPKISKIIQTADGYEADIVIYSVLYLEVFYEKKVILDKSGKVTITQEPKIIEKIVTGIRLDN